MNAQAIQSAEILVRYTNPAEDGKKPTIKASDGTYFYVKPVDFGRFQQGGRYRIDYTQRDYKGRTYRDVVKCEPIRSEPASSGDSRPRAPSPAQTSVPAGEGVTDATHTEEFEFVTRLLSAYVTGGGVDRTPDALIERGKGLREVYRRIFVA